MYNFHYWRLSPLYIQRYNAINIIIYKSKMNAEVMGISSDPFYGAPTVVIVLADKTRSTYKEDGSLVMGNLMNAEYSVVADSCWIHRYKEVLESERGKEFLKD